MKWLLFCSPSKLPFLHLDFEVHSGAIAFDSATNLKYSQCLNQHLDWVVFAASNILSFWLRQLILRPKLCLAAVEIIGP